MLKIDTQSAVEHVIGTKTINILDCVYFYETKHGYIYQDYNGEYFLLSQDEYITILAGLTGIERDHKNGKN